MQEIFRHHDSSTVGLLDGILRESGISTLLKNWTGGNITEIPIPSLYPSIHVLDDSQAEEAKQIIKEYMNQALQTQPAWVCPQCKCIVDSALRSEKARTGPCRYVCNWYNPRRYKCDRNGVMSEWHGLKRLGR